jgi:hypothetical protein
MVKQVCLPEYARKKRMANPGQAGTFIHKECGT